MTEQISMGAQVAVTVPLDPEQAFDLFVDGFDKWWPNDGTHSLTEAKGFVMEPKAEGRWGELTPDGGYQPWGRVLEVDRPRRILLAWQLTPEFTYDADPAKQSEVEVTFEEEGPDATRVTLEHRGLEVWGEAGAEMRDSVKTGWGTLLELYAGHAAP
jgi:uncharacterized protein YndB with AHSA1/START domain